MIILKKIVVKIKKKYLIKFNIKKYIQYIGVKQGSCCRFISVTSSTFGSEPYLVEIGNNVTITKNVQFLTHDGSLDLFRENEPDLEFFGKIIVGDKVFIGYGVILLPRTIIGSNVIIGAGSVVKGVLESNSVYAGVPAKKICSIDEFYQKNSKFFSQTKRMDPISKRSFLEGNFF